MAVTYGFYNSLNKDRMYNAEQMSSIFNGIITDGVFSTIGDALMTVAGTGMQVIVKPGRAWFNSTWTLNDAQLPLDVPTADVSLTRIDAVILEVNSAVATRANSIKILKGTPSANPAKPTLSATETLHQYALAYITVAAGVMSITAANIEVNVGKTTCPFITSVLQQTDITDLFNQWEAEFTAWFENIQSQLAGDVAANLQRQIDALKDTKMNLVGPYGPGILSDATKAAFLNQSIENPNDAFAYLAKFSQYWWEKQYNNNYSEYVEKRELFTGYTTTVPRSTRTAKTISINQSTGAVSLGSDALAFTYSDSSKSGVESGGSALMRRCPCYIEAINSGLGSSVTVMYIPSVNSVYSYWSNRNDDGYVGLYHDSNDISFPQAYRVPHVVSEFVQHTGGSIEFVQSASKDAYSEGGTANPKYVSLGIPYESFIGALRTTHGSFTKGSQAALVQCYAKPWLMFYWKSGLFGIILNSNVGWRCDENNTSLSVSYADGFLSINNLPTGSYDYLAFY